jgi:hypothetical protein
MITTTPSVSDTSSSVSATAALSCMQGELTGELCTLAAYRHRRLPGLRQPSHRQRDSPR